MKQLHFVPDIRTVLVAQAKKKGILLEGKPATLINADTCARVTNGTMTYEYDWSVVRRLLAADRNFPVLVRPAIRW